MKTALIQLCSSDDPETNLEATRALVAEAAAGGAEFVLTPEVTNCVSASRTHQREVLAAEEQDITLAGLREQAADLGIWLLIGSIAVTTDDPDGRFANRSFMVNPSGDVVARYDKIHMFDVEVTAEETYRESAGFRPGDRAVTVETPFGKVGMTICYDLRFPGLYQSLAAAGATILTVPAAFSPVTGAAHWEPILRARAIETGCFVLAPAQTGTHAASRGKQRRTWGHSIAVSPWGEVLAEGGTEPGVTLFDLDPRAVPEARRRVPSMANARSFAGPA